MYSSPKDNTYLDEMVVNYTSVTIIILHTRGYYAKLTLLYEILILLLSYRFLLFSYRKSHRRSEEIPEQNR